MADFLNNPFVNAGMGLGGGLGAMPVAAPYTTAGVIPGAAMQFSNMKEATPYMAGLFGGAGAAGGAMAMQPRSNSTEYAPFGGDKAEPEQISNTSQAEYAPFGGDTAPQTEYAPFGGDTASASPQQQTPDATSGNNAEAFRMMARGIQNMAPRVQFPSGNTAQIIRDNNQFRFAGTPQQQMANALRRR